MRVLPEYYEHYRRCLRCGRSNEVDAVTCKYCGADIETDLLIEKHILSAARYIYAIWMTEEDRQREDIADHINKEIDETAKLGYLFSDEVQKNLKNVKIEAAYRLAYEILSAGGLLYGHVADNIEPGPMLIADNEFIEITPDSVLGKNSDIDE